MEKSEEYFREAGQTLLRDGAVLLANGEKRIGDTLVKHWFVYEYKGEVRLLTAEQHIQGEKTGFSNANGSPVFFSK